MVVYVIAATQMYPVEAISRCTAQSPVSATCRWGCLCAFNNLHCTVQQKGTAFALTSLFSNILSIVHCKVDPYCGHYCRDTLHMFGISKGIACFLEPPSQMPLRNPSTATTCCHLTAVPLHVQVTLREKGPDRDCPNQSKLPTTARARYMSRMNWNHMNSTMRKWTKG
jgi:hypothetical protein